MLPAKTDNFLLPFQFGYLLFFFFFFIYLLWLGLPVQFEYEWWEWTSFLVLDLRGKTFLLSLLSMIATVWSYVAFVILVCVTYIPYWEFLSWKNMEFLLWFLHIYRNDHDFKLILLNHTYWFADVTLSLHLRSKSQLGCGVWPFNVLLNWVC